MTDRTTPTVVAGVVADRPCPAQLSFAAHLAEQRSARLHVLCAYPASPRQVEGWAALHARIDAQLAELIAPVAEAHPDLTISSAIAWVTPWEALRTVSEEVELIVLGSQPRSWWSQLFDTNTAPVAATANCPVLVVPQNLSDTEELPTRVILGVNDSGASMTAARFAVAQAAAWDTELVAVSALPHEYPAARRMAPAASRELEEADCAELVKHTLAQARNLHPQVPIRHVVTRGRAADRLREQAGANDLVVVGSRGRGNLAALLLGSVSRDLLRTATSPVAVVTEGDERACDVAARN